MSIHALFSVSPDRARLHRLRDGNSQDLLPAKWNAWLLHGPIPMAWIRLLSRLADLYPRQSTFEWWPRHVDGSQDILNDALDTALKIIGKESLPLWSTQVGHVTAKNGLLSVKNLSEDLREAFQEAKIPVIYPPDRLHHRILYLFEEQLLNPLRLSLFLMDKNSQIRKWSLSTKKAVLEYLVSEPCVPEYGSLELFPFEDGKYRSIANHAAFVHRNPFEKELFQLQPDHNIDLSKLSPETVSILKQGCKTLTLHKSLCHRSPTHFKDYCKNFVFSEIPKDKDMVRLNPKATSFVSSAWMWIVEHQIDILGTVCDLWLVPLTNSHHRKIKPAQPTSETIFAPTGPTGDIIRLFDEKYSSKSSPILDTRPNGLSDRARVYLMTAAAKDTSVMIRNSSKVIEFTKWLRQIRKFVNSASKEEKTKVTQAIAMNLMWLPQSERRAIGNTIGDLEIFRKVTWKAEGDKQFVKPPLFVHQVN